MITAICAALALTAQGTSAPTNSYSITVQNPTSYSGKAVSLNFSGSVSDLLKQLKKEGINFVAVDPDLGTKKVTVNVTQRPVDELLDAVGASLGGHWSKKGETYAFVKGGAYGIFPSGQLNSGLRFNRTLPKDLEKQFDSMKLMIPDMKGMQEFNFSGPDQKAMEELKKRFKDMPKMQNFRTFSFGQSDITAFTKSLTDDQRALMKKHGYLKSSDLTAKQRTQLGVPEKGYFEFRFKQDGDEIVVKSE